MKDCKSSSTNTPGSLDKLGFKVSLVYFEISLVYVFLELKSKTCFGTVC